MDKKKLKPAIEGDWHIGPNPTTLDSEVQAPFKPGEFRGGQEVVDHHIWQDAKGNWRLWACIRYTRVGRVFVGWVSDDLEKEHWQCLGVVMRRDKNAGESLADRGDRLIGEVLQSPFVIRANGQFWMYYGGGYADAGQYLDMYSMCLASSPDGISFTRHRNEFDQSILFYGPGHARDPSLIEIDGLWHLYYSGWETGFKELNRLYVRTSKNLVDWSATREVCWGGSPG